VDLFIPILSIFVSRTVVARSDADSDAQCPSRREQLVVCVYILLIGGILRRTPTD